MPHPFDLSCLCLDLGSRTHRLYTLGEDLSRSFLGGRGIGVAFLGASPTLDPLDPEAPLVLATGPLTGSRIPSAGRMTVTAFSPLTSTVCSSSVGGSLAVQMRKAGIDVIHITGRATSKLCVLVSDTEVRFEDANLPDDIPLSVVFERLAPFGGSVAAAGSAAFMGCLYASIAVDSSFSSGRGGLGLVMASKNLRALAVRGSGSAHRQACDARAEETARTDIIRLFDASPFIRGRSGIAAYGTSSLVDLIASRRMMPTANFRKTFFEGYRAFAGPAIRERHRAVHYACHGCPIACKQKASREIPEYETLSHFGALNENDDLESIIEANRVCNEIGVDTISAGATIACLAEIRGTRFTGESLVDAVRSINGHGREAELLRTGSARLARELGMPGASMSVKSLELPAYDPRGAYGMALAYGTSTRGGCHLRAYPIAHEILRKPVATDRFSFSGKARIIKLAEDLNAVVDSIGACKFAFLAASLEEYAKGFAAVTGLDMDTQDLLRMGDAVYTLERHLNTLRGFRRADDMLPERFFTEAGSSGPDVEITPIDRGAYGETLDRYYRIRGCNPDGTLGAERVKGLIPCVTR
jgi:aldehyde:ferredoxin oxidoreductase